MQAAGCSLRISSPDADETWPGGDPSDATIEIAKRKLAKIDDPALTLAADTVVMIDGAPLGKPKDHDDAVRMLQMLAGREHRVVTGFCLRQGNTYHADAVITKVGFRPLTREEIEYYISHGESLDKAGAYAVQGIGGALIDHIEGSYTNVIGLPLPEVLQAVDILAKAAP